MVIERSGIESSTKKRLINFEKQISMAMYKIAKIKFETEIDVSQQNNPEDIFKSGRWNKYGETYTKDDDLTRCSLQRVKEKMFVLEIELTDLFFIELDA